MVPIPEGYESADAAPLMCAGATVWTCLTEYGVRPTDRVGVMGIGGLGHLAIKLASAMGCHVVVFSSSEAKREEAFSFGASEYHVFRAGQELKDCKPVNHLLLCGSANVDYSSYVTASMSIMLGSLTNFFPQSHSFDGYPWINLPIDRRLRTLPRSAPVHERQGYPDPGIPGGVSAEPSVLGAVRS